MMLYKKHQIEPQYLPGSDFKLVNGKVTDRNPTVKDIDFYWITCPDGYAFRELTIKEAKQTIDGILSP